MMKTTLMKLTELLKDKSGGIIIMFAFGILLIAGVFALAINHGTNFVSQAKVQDIVRNSITYPAQELAYMQIRCETGANPRPGLLLPNCIPMAQAADVACAEARRSITTNRDMPKGTEVTSCRYVSVPNKPLTYLYIAVRYPLEDNFNLGNKSQKFGTIEAAKTVIDGVSTIALTPVVFGLKDSSKYATASVDFSTSVQNAINAIEKLGYEMSSTPAWGAMLYGEAPQIPNGTLVNSPNPNKNYGWSGAAAERTTAIQHRIYPFVGEFMAQPTRMCGTGKATWTAEVRDHPTEFCKVKDVERIRNEMQCSPPEPPICWGASGCTGKVESDCKASSSSGCNWGTPFKPWGCYDDCNGDGRREGWETDRFRRCQNCESATWYNYDYCWRKNVYKQAVYYHSCEQIRETSMGGGAGVVLDEKGFGGVYGDPKEYLEFRAEYIGPNPHGNATYGVELVGEVTESTSVSANLQRELRDLKGQNTRDMIVWDCTNVVGYGTALYNIRAAHGGRKFSEPDAQRTADCIANITNTSKTYRVSFKRPDCDISSLRNCDVPEGYWKIYATLKKNLKPTIYASQTQYLLGGTGFVAGNDVVAGQIPGPYCTGCDANRGWCRDRNTGVCNLDNYFMCAERLISSGQGKFGDPLIANAGVPAEQLYISSFNIENGRPNGVISTAVYDTFGNPSTESGKFSKRGADLNTQNGIRFSDEVSLVDGLLVLSGDNIKVGDKIELGSVSNSAAQITALHSLSSGGMYGQGMIQNSRLGGTRAEFESVMRQRHGGVPLENHGACGAVERAVDDMLSYIGTNKDSLPILLAGMTCPADNTCTTPYEASNAPWAYKENSNYQIAANHLLTNVACNSGFNYGTDATNCITRALNRLKAAQQSGIFPINLGNQSGCSDYLKQFASDPEPAGGSLGYQFCPLGEGKCTSNDLAAEIAWKILKESGIVAKEITEGTADSKIATP